MTEIQRQGFQYALYSALRYGSPGQFKVLPVRLGSFDDRVNEVGVSTGGGRRT